ncbi:hypothetical protein ACFXNW_25295 [Nocardia sp. NPDC059180]|uniref:hypothetical protein n=1 Tax=Nocardia sp. NPDC059180 TaxID=3346761 RepID=UPI003686E699
MPPYQGPPHHVPPQQVPQYPAAPAPYPAAPPPPFPSAPPQPPPPGPGSGPAQAYIGAVAQRLMADQLRIQHAWVGPVQTMIGIITINPLASFGSPVEFVLGVAEVPEVSPMAMDNFPRQLDQFARSQRSLGALGGAMSVAALVSERVHPAALSRLTTRAQWGSGVLPAIADLGTRQLHMATDSPIFGYAMWGKLRKQANRYLPHPAQVLG